MALSPKVCISENGEDSCSFASRVLPEAEESIPIGARYRFEDGGLLIDSLNSNNLTDFNGKIINDLADYKEGLASAYYQGYNDFSGSGMYILDADLQEGFPLKSGDTIKEITICFWLKHTNQNNTQMIWSKGVGSGSGSLEILDAGGNIAITARRSNGTSMPALWFEFLDLNKWYHIGISINGITGAVRCRIWDDNASTIHQDLTQYLLMSGYEMKVSTGIMGIGAQFNDNETWAFSGLGNQNQPCFLDDFVILSGILTADDIDSIRSNTYF